MKTLAICLSTLLSVGAFAQGTYNFSLAGVGVNAPVSNILTGARVPAGAAFVAQLFYAPAGTTAENLFLAATNGGPSPFSSAGYVVNSSPAFVPAGGTSYALQVRAWEAALGADWTTALQAWQTGSAGANRLLGKSKIIEIKSGDPNAAPPTLPSNLAGLPGFYVVPVPEPSVIALGVLGLIALAWRRRN